jgi:PrcB C-terminal
VKHQTAFTFVAAVVATACLNAGCAEAHHVDVMTVLANGNCQTNEIGVRAIDYATLATYRGTHLIGMTESAESTQSPAHLIAIVPGQFPTPGYNITLQHPATLSVDLLTLQISTEHPPADAVLAQMITHPCLVVGIADPIVRRVRVVGDNATVLGEVALSGK